MAPYGTVYKIQIGVVDVAVFDRLGCTQIVVMKFISEKRLTNFKQSKRSKSDEK